MRDVTVFEELCSKSAVRAFEAALIVLHCSFCFLVVIL